MVLFLSAQDKERVCGVHDYKCYVQCWWMVLGVVF